MFYLKGPFLGNGWEPDTFWSLCCMNDDEISALLAEVDADDLAAAFSGGHAHEALRDRLLAQCDEATAEKLKAAAASGPAPDMEDAKNRVLAVARQVLTLDGVTIPSVHVFQDLAHISQEEAKQLCDGIGHTDLALALKAADDPTKEAVLAGMTPEKREELTNHMEEMGPVRLSCVQRVQMALVQAVRAEDPFV